MNQVPLDQLSFATFKELVKTRFQVEVAATTVVELELIEVEFHSESPRDKSRQPTHENFSLIFSGDARDRLAQRTYLLSHERIGAFELFIVPIALDEGTMRYQAVFNRLLPAQ